MIFVAEKTGSTINIIGKIIEFFKAVKDGKYRVSIEPFKKLRSTEFNRYYWLYLRVIEEETGDDANSLHEIFKRKFLPPRFVHALGKEWKLPATTTGLSTAEFFEYIARIEALTGIPAPAKELL